jgi:hypothetical protein
MFAAPNQPQSIGGVLDSGFKLLAASLGKVLPFTYLASLLTAGWTWKLQTVLMRDFAKSGAFNFNGSVVSGSYLVVIVVGSIFAAAVLCTIRAVHNGESSSFGAALTARLRRAPALFVVTLLYALASVVGLLLLLIPGMYLGVTLAFSFYATAADDKGAIESLKYSHALVKGDWWRTASLLSVIMIIAVVLYVAVGLVAGLFDGGNGPIPSLEPDFVTDVVIMPVFAALIMAMFYCLGYAAYVDLKLRNELTDVAD